MFFFNIPKSIKFSENLELNPEILVMEFLQEGGKIYVLNYFIFINIRS